MAQALPSHRTCQALAMTGSSSGCRELQTARDAVNASGNVAILREASAAPPREHAAEGSPHVGTLESLPCPEGRTHPQHGRHRGIVIAPATAAAVAAGEHAAGVQPYADSLVSMLLMSLPWADDTLVRGSGEAMAQLLDLVGQYMEARPVRTCPALAPFLESGGEDDLAAQSDSGAASFLPQVRGYRAIGLSVWGV